MIKNECEINIFYDKMDFRLFLFWCGDIWYNTIEDVIDFEVQEFIRKGKRYIFEEQNITFPPNKKTNFLHVKE